MKQMNCLFEIIGHKLAYALILYSKVPTIALPYVEINSVKKWNL